MKEIYFFSLERALSGIGDALELELPINVPRRADFVMAWRYSQAAAHLHQVLHNVAEGRPKWLMPHPVTRRPVATEAAAAEGIAILEDVAGWFSRHCRTIDAFPNYGDRQASTEDELMRTVYSSKFKSGKLGRDSDVGFDRTELILYLDSPQVDIPHWIVGGQTVEYIRQLEARRRSRVSDFPPVRVMTAPSSLAEAHSKKERAAPRLVLPANADTWAKAIEATYEAMIQETNAVPLGLEVWLRMNHKPPANYPIAVTKDHGLAAIALPGEKLLTRDGFMKRWSRYTADK